MASYNEYFKITVGGTNESVESICEAIKNYAPTCEIDCSKNEIIVTDMCRISESDDAREFAQILARASNGANFIAKGDTECSVSGEMMAFIIEFNNGKLTMCDSEWYTESCPSMFEDYETYEDYCEDYDEIENEEDFEIAKKQNTFFVDDTFCLELPYLETVSIEY